MAEPLSKIPDGMRYYYGAEARLRRAVEDRVMAIFEGWSYEEITTPAVDYFALFERGMGRDEAERAFRFTDVDGRMLALRPDVTSSVARAASTLLAEAPRPLRLCYAAPVFRQTPRSHAEWRRESKQLGGEFIGAASRVADAEILIIAAEMLDVLKLSGRYRITLNSVEVFNGISQELALKDEAREELRQIIDRRDAAGTERFIVGAGAARAGMSWPAAFARQMQMAGQREILDRARQVITNRRSIAALDALSGLWRIIEATGLEGAFEIDLGDVARLDYYTGLTFKIYAAGAGAPIGGGGRYDRLSASFGGAEPAVGFVLDLDALTDVLRRESSARERPRGTESPERLIIAANNEPSALFRNAIEARAAGKRVRVELTDGPDA